VKNLLKSQLYQVVREPLIWTMLLLSLMGAYSEYKELLEYGWQTNNYLKQNGYNGSVAAAYFEGNICSTLVILLIIAISVIICRDFQNQTIKGDVLAGKTKNQAVMSRVIIALTVSVFMTFALMYIPILYATKIYGFGDGISLKKYIFYSLIVIIILIRICLEIIWISVKVRKVSLTVVISMIIFLGEEILYELIYNIYIMLHMDEAAFEPVNLDIFFTGLSMPSSSMLLCVDLSEHYGLDGAKVTDVAQGTTTLNTVIISAVTVVIIVISIIRIRKLAISKDMD